MDELGTRQAGFTSLRGFRAWVVSAVAVSLIFAFQSYYPDLIGPISNVLPTVCVTVTFASALLSVRRYGIRSRKRFQAIWLFFALGSGLWLLAESSWAFYYFILNVAVPYPSIADIFYVSGYLPVILALSLYLSDFSAGMSRRRLAIVGLAIVAVVSVALGLVIPVEFSSNPSALQLATDLLYPALDLVLFSLSALSLAIFFGGSLAKWWGLVGIGAIWYVIGDEYFLFQVAQGTYYNGSVDDLFFLLGYLFLALAFYAHRSEL